MAARAQQVAVAADHLGGDGLHHVHVVHGDGHIACVVQEGAVAGRAPAGQHQGAAGVDPGGGALDDLLAEGVVAHGGDQAGRHAQVGQVLGHVARHAAQAQGHRPWLEVRGISGGAARALTSILAAPMTTT